MIQRMFERIKKLLGLVIPNERDILFQQTHKSWCNLCIIMDEATQEVCLPLKTLKLVEGCWRR
jgi:hypothetical protein